MHKIHYAVTTSRLGIYVDEELWREASPSILSRKPPLPKECSDLNELSKLFTALEYKGAKQYAYKRLARQNLSTADLLRLLSAKWVSHEISEQVIAELRTGDISTTIAGLNLLSASSAN